MEWRHSLPLIYKSESWFVDEWQLFVRQINDESSLNLWQIADKLWPNSWQFKSTVA
jgi:hypothetical protein